jgi:hypothetical protein
VIDADSPVPISTRPFDEAGDAFGHPLRRIGGQLHDAVAKPDVLGALRGGGQEHLGRRGMGVLLQEMMLHLPGVIITELVGQLDLIKRILIQLPFVIRPPRARQLQLVEDAEFHGLSPDLLPSIPPDTGQSVKLRTQPPISAATH